MKHFLLLTITFSLLACSNSDPSKKITEAAARVPSPEKTIQEATVSKTTSDELKALIDDMNKDTQIRLLSPGKSLMEIPQAVPATLTFVSCFNSADAAVSFMDNGIKLVKGSSALIKRDLSYVFGDGTTPKKAEPFALFLCYEEKETTSLSAPNLDVKVLKAGSVDTFSIVTSPSNYHPKMSANFLVNCVATAREAKASKGKGIFLLPQSQLVIEDHTLVKCDK